MWRTGSWRPPAWHGWLLLLAAALCLLVLPAVDLGGRVLVLPLCVALAALGLRDLVLAPVLAVDETSLTVVEGLRRRTVPLEQVERIRTVTDRRTPLLEVDLGSTVVVLSARRLGAPVEDVARQLSRDAG